ncbi:hypothetical protein NADFUDRAFT_39284 [Nadsonia fulvescens var. elongata DSM 6958]|uniref:SIN1-domain-containing protein n=1 Tax=Nadsonia fulvescens var. elongata DSM 6958 TaxID=857566 RepID=A0A1E3PR16_9ASCO|nr:hypothetical protein NADFUDRAFT_39284 [Nadsonia fulvescens var. elongata DSM 6958]
MSLLEDSDYLISHLRSTYLDIFRDGIGEKIIRPVPAYLRNEEHHDWQNQYLSIIMRSESPPIPTDTLSDTLIPYKRKKKGINVTNSSDEEDLSILRNGGRDGRLLNNTKRVFSGRKRASTLPSLSSPTLTTCTKTLSSQWGDNIRGSRARSEDSCDSLSEFTHTQSEGIPSIMNELSFGDTRNDSVINNNYEDLEDSISNIENENDDYENDYGNDFEVGYDFEGSGEDENVDGIEDKEANDNNFVEAVNCVSRNTNDISDYDHMTTTGSIDTRVIADTSMAESSEEYSDLSGLTDEDESDMEDDIKLAAKQLKPHQPSALDDPSLSASATNSASILNDSIHQRQMSLDVINSRFIGSTPRQMSGSVRTPRLKLKLSVERLPKLYFGKSDSFSYDDSSQYLDQPIGSKLSHTAIANTEPKLSQKPSSTNLLSDLSSSASFVSSSFISTRKKDVNVHTNTLEYLIESSMDLPATKIETFDLENSINDESSLSRMLQNLKHSVKPQSSNLTAQIKIKQSEFDNPLEEYIGASGKSEQKPLRLKIFMPSCSEPRRPWEVVVKGDADVANAIGYALYRYKEERRIPPLPIEKCDANQWNLCIVEEDGEPDEDFPALNRNRIISAYSFDEFALVEATPEQVKENERITPNKVTQYKNNAAKSGNMDSMILDFGSTPKLKVESVVLHIFQYPFHEDLSTSLLTLSTTLETYIAEILDKVCAKRYLDVALYSLKIVGTKIVVANDRTIKSLQGHYDLELTPKRVISTANGYILPSKTTDPNTPFLKSTYCGNPGKSMASTLPFKNNDILNNDNFSKHIRNYSVVRDALTEPLSSATYQKYHIWRRQPMSFISRHERVLAIDGEYVHIMPSDDKTWFESPKTSSFHVKQITNCKQSKKVPNNFKILVMKANGPKRYDLEATSHSQAAEIVTKIRKLVAKHRMDS